MVSRSFGLWVCLLAALGCGESIAPGDLPVLEYVSPVNAYTGEAVVFDASGSFDPDGEVVWYGFEFGDGGGAVRGLDPVAVHGWERAGLYVTRVTVVDDQGNKSSELREILVVDRGSVSALVCQIERPHCPPFLVCEDQGYTCVADRDGDGVRDEEDVCPDQVDPSQRDTDGDGVGDQCSTDGYSSDRAFCRVDGDCPPIFTCSEGLCRKKRTETP